MTAAIVGWANTAFGKYDNETVEAFIVKATTSALEHAGVSADEVDEIVLGHFNAGFSRQDFTAALCGVFNKGRAAVANYVSMREQIF
jgi:acetyl-CoA C-acetyltransferase